LPRVELAFDLPRADEADDLAFFPLFFFPPFAPPVFRGFFGVAFLLALLAARLTALGAFFATALTAFFTGAAKLSEPARRPTAAPMTPPITAPTGPTTLPTTAPAAAPAASFEIGGIWIFSDDSLDCWLFWSAIR
jgi:hypothetical protein